jgi:hypothetical protein
MRPPLRAGTRSSRPVPPPPSFIARLAAVMHDVFGHATHYLYAEQDGAIVGVLPLAQVKSLLFGHALVSLPFCVYGGVAPATKPPPGAGGRGRAHRTATRRAAPGTAPARTRHADWPRQDLYVTFRKPILPDEEANMLAIPRKQRAMVRKGIKNGLVASSTPTWSASSRCMPTTCTATARRPCPSATSRPCAACSAPTASVLTVTTADGRPSAAC